MNTALVYWKLEWKRAWKRIPHIYGGAILLMCLLSGIALLSTRALYGDQVVGRISVGVVLPKEDLVAEKVISMVSTMESVKSLCDFTYLPKEEAYEQLRKNRLYAIMEIPEGFVQDIMNGTNTPVNILLPDQGGVEGRIFRELTDAGAKILSSSQAGIYAGGDLCYRYGLESSIGELEGDLNRIYLGYSLPRLDYFRHRQVSGVGDVDTITFYACSGMVLFLLLCGIPVCGYLSPMGAAMRQKLDLLGVNSLARVCGRILGMTGLLLTVALPVFFVASSREWVNLSMVAVGILLLLCLGVASFLVLLYQGAGSLMGGVMGLFLLGIAQHFISGGFLPSVFLPKIIQGVGEWMPSAIWMNGLKIMVTGVWSWQSVVSMAMLLVICTGLSVAGEVKS